MGQASTWRLPQLARHPEIWLDTRRFTRGNLTYRHMLAGKPAVLHTRLVARADLADALPPDTTAVTGEQRVAQM